MALFSKCGSAIFFGLHNPIFTLEMIKLDGTLSSTSKISVPAGDYLAFPTEMNSNSLEKMLEFSSMDNTVYASNMMHFTLFVICCFS